jgi:hypothetical protein
VRITVIKIQPETAIKIFEKHDVLQEELYDVLKNDAPIFRKVGGDQHLAIGYSRSRYLTIFFHYNNKEVEITTAYPSDKKQIKYYKRETK